MWARITALGTLGILFLTAVLVWLTLNRPSLAWWSWPAIVFIAVAMATAAVLNFKVLKSKAAAPPTDIAEQSKPSWLQNLADEDSADMNKRLILCGTSATLNVDTVEPYIDVTFRIVNTSVFSLMTQRVEGNATYWSWGDSSKTRCYLSRTPIIADSLNLFTLGRGELGELKLKQFVPLEITDVIAHGNGKLKINFREVRIAFRFPGTGGRNEFWWFGDEVELTFPN